MWLELAQVLGCFADMADIDHMNVAIKQARAAESAQFEAMLSLSDARILRLENLLEIMTQRLSRNSKLGELFELNVQQGIKPKLWIDLVSAVVMEPDPSTFRLTQDSELGRETLFETADTGQMADYVVRYLAQRVVLREKALATKAVAAPAPYTSRDMIYVWLTGCVFGAMVLLTLAMYLKKLTF